MFEFQKLEVYKKAKLFYINNKAILGESRQESFVKDQLSRASFSVALNLAEGSGKFTNADRKKFFTIARASVFECVAILDILKDEKKIKMEVYQSQLEMADELSRVLYSMIKKLMQQ